MWQPMLLYGILSLGVAAFSIAGLVASQTLSLPTPLLQSIAAVTISILAPILNVYYMQQQRTTSFPSTGKPTTGSSSTAPRARQPAQPLAPTSLLQILMTVLATLFGHTFFTSDDVLGCELGTKWQALFRNKQSGPIRRIQDRLGCCGFRSTKDMAWPFSGGVPGGGGKDEAGKCQQMFGRDTACLVGWKERTRWWAGAEGAVLIVMVVFQLFLAWYGRRRGAEASMASGARGGADGAGGRRKLLAYSGEDTRPLLGIRASEEGRRSDSEGDDDGDDVDDDAGQGRGTRYGSVVEEQLSLPADNAWRDS